MTIRFPKRDRPLPISANRAERRYVRARFVGAIRRFPFFWELLYRLEDDFYGLDDFDFSRTPMWWGVILRFDMSRRPYSRYRLLCVGPLFRPKHFPDLVLDAKAFTPWS